MSADEFDNTLPAADRGDTEPAMIVDVEGFEGPLDLLLTLARQQKVDLAKISILALADQHLSFIEAARRVAGLRERFTQLQEQAALASLESPLDGNELMRLFDRPPGPWIKRVKEHLRELVIDGELAPDDRDRAAQIAASLLETDEQPNEAQATIAAGVSRRPPR